MHLCTGISWERRMYRMLYTGCCLRQVSLLFHIKHTTQDTLLDPSGW